MDRSIRRLGAFIMLLFCALFVQLNYIQVFRASDLNTKTGNNRPIDQSFAKPRGTIATADGVLLARSVPSDDRFQYQREYPEGERYAALTGASVLTVPWSTAAYPIDAVLSRVTDRTAMIAVSSSRTSPRKMMSGSCRIKDLMPDWKSIVPSRMLV